MKVLFLNTSRDSYSPEYCTDCTIKVGDLIEHLSYFDEDTPVVFKNDRGYTFGSFDEESFEEEVLSDTNN